MSKTGGAALAGAKVEVTEKGIVMATDEGGEFYREELDAGEYTIRVTKEGFKEVIIKNVVITLDETTELTVEMEAVPVA